MGGVREEGEKRVREERGENVVEWWRINPNQNRCFYFVRELSLS